MDGAVASSAADRSPSSPLDSDPGGVLPHYPSEVSSSTNYSRLSFGSRLSSSSSLSTLSSLCSMRSELMPPLLATYGRHLYSSTPSDLPPRLVLASTGLPPPEPLWRLSPSVGGIGVDGGERPESRVAPLPRMSTPARGHAPLRPRTRGGGAAPQQLPPSASLPNLAKSIGQTEKVLISRRKGASRGDLAYVTGQLQRGNITWTTPMRL